ncbi:MAG: hypothetical protein CTY16_15415 [Methylobacter sp.]|nr:MAG: hypothetical protein CTY16_15415 [Methylobacter sp.]
MSWQHWADELRQEPKQAVADLLRGAADIAPFERVAAHEFLLAVLPRNSRNIRQPLLGERSTETAETDTDLPAYIDTGLSAWLLAQRQVALPPTRKLSAYAAQVCEALQWPLFFNLPQTLVALRSERVLWLSWLASLNLSAYRDPEYDYWQVLAAHQTDDSLQFFWQSFVVEAGRLRSARYLNLGLLALARLPLSDEDSLRNLRLQVQSLINRYQRRKGWGVAAQEELAQSLQGVMVRNPSMNAANYRAFLAELLAPLGDHKTLSVLALLGLEKAAMQHRISTLPKPSGKLSPPALTDATDQAVRAVRESKNLAQAWHAISPLLSAHEDYLHKSGDAYYFVRTLDCCARVLCKKYPIHDPEIQARLFQLIHLALRVEEEDPRLWMLWGLTLRQAGQPQRARWVLWEMTRRFPNQLPCRVDLARLLVDSGSPDDQSQAQRLLRQVLQLDPENLHAHSTLAQLAIRRKDWPQALTHAQEGLRIDPSDGASAILLAKAHSWRDEPGDLQTAINRLQHFVDKCPGNVKAEDYLRRLLQRQQSVAQGMLPSPEDEDVPVGPDLTAPETDAAWQVFADSIRAWVSAEIGGEATHDDVLWIGRVLPLPQALRQAVAGQHWDADVLDAYDTAAQREFPLEIRLWRYFQTFQSGNAEAREQAKQSVQTWLDSEARSAKSDEQPWLNYLNQHWHRFANPDDIDLADCSEWLKDLLGRYQPLPVPLLV